jgi:hypothetical protein
MRPVALAEGSGIPCHNQALSSFKKPSGKTPWRRKWDKRIVRRGAGQGGRHAHVLVVAFEVIFVFDSIGRGS